MYNTFEELEDGILKRQISNLAISIGFPLKKILTMDGSKRSAHSNAYFFGFWKNKRIVLFDTLIRNLNIDEIVSVIGHELGHWKYRHVFWNLMIFMV
jgi:STE24 endopeptidase